MIRKMLIMHWRALAKLAGWGPAQDRAPTGSSEKSSLANRLRQLSAEVLDQHQVALGADNS